MKLGIAIVVVMLILSFCISVDNRKKCDEKGGQYLERENTCVKKDSIINLRSA